MARRFSPCLTNFHANLFDPYSRGAFGKVRLVKVKASESGEFYALKAQGKHFIVENKQQKYVLNELSLVRASWSLFMGNLELTCILSSLTTSR